MIISQDISPKIIAHGRMSKLVNPLVEIHRQKLKGPLPGEVDGESKMNSICGQIKPPPNTPCPHFPGKQCGDLARVAPHPMMSHHILHSECSMGNVRSSAGREHLYRQQVVRDATWRPHSREERAGRVKRYPPETYPTDPHSLWSSDASDATCG